MTHVPYISIKSVLYELSRLIPDSQWNELDFMEWANKALRRINVGNKYQEHVCYLPVVEHKASLPSDLKYLIQILYTKPQSDDQVVEELKEIMNFDSPQWNPAIVHMDNPDGLAEAAASIYSAKFRWLPMKASTNVFLTALTCTPSLFPHLANSINRVADCEHEYTINADGIITTTLNNGIIAVSYLRLPVEDNDTTLVPDNETLKEAILNYCLSQYYLKRDILGETNADKKMMYHKQMFGHMAAKASAELNTPDIPQMENLKNMLQRLVPRSNQHRSMFSKLNNAEKLRY